jgi:hypothetical protein
MSDEEKDGSWKFYLFWAFLLLILLGHLYKSANSPSKVKPSRYDSEYKAAHEACESVYGANYDPECIANVLRK